MIAINKKVQLLLDAITEHEGWHAVGSKTHRNGSIAYRNHNPGNLRSSPFQISTNEGFAVFNGDMVGLMALQWDLLQKSKGNTVTSLNGDSTLRDLIFTYAPPGDNNDSEAYLQAVLTKTGFSNDITLRQIFEN